MVDFPPPPEEAQRIISKLLPMVSSDNTKKKHKSDNQPKLEKELLPCMALTKKINPRKMDKISTIATQTTLPKTRRRKPFVWESKNQLPLRLHILSRTQSKYGSFPYVEAFHFPKYFPWMQKSGLPLTPKTLPSSLDKHIDVQKKNSGESSSFGFIKNNFVEENPGDFSEDFLNEKILPLTKRENIAWELGFEDEAYLTPGSTKVIGRRRKKSAEHSSSNSIHRLEGVEISFEPFQSTEDKNMSLYNDAEGLMFPEALPLDLTFNGTYVIKKGKNKEKSYFNKNSCFDKQPKVLQQLNLNPDSHFKRIRSTFYDIKFLLKENDFENMKDLSPLKPSTLIRVVSLPNLSLEETEIVSNVDISSKFDHFCNLKESLIQEKAKDEINSLQNLTLAYYEKVEDKKFNCIKVGKNKKVFETEKNLRKQMKKCNEVETQTDLSDVEKQNDLESIEQDLEISKTKSELEEVEKKIQEIVKIKTVIEQQAQEEFGNLLTREGVFDKKPPHRFNVNVEILQHDFGPLPPSPVDEYKEYSNSFEIASAQLPTDKADILSKQFYLCENPCVSDSGGKYLNKPPETLQHRTSDPVSSISRFMDVGLKKVSREYLSELKKEKTTERLTLPSEFHGPVVRRQTFQKKSLTLPQENSQASCFLPEAPIFVRGCDIPRTPIRYAPDTIRQRRLQNNKFQQNGIDSNSPNCKIGISLSGELNQAMVGGELLRLAGGPGRGWYPRHRQHRPSSIEQLDRLPHSERGMPEFWDIGGCRKPLTLPSNITPKFFHRSPREALRRVTSLLIRGKGTSSKEKKETLPPPRFSDATEHRSQKKGFFRNFWKRSRHYSLDQQ